MKVRAGGSPAFGGFPVLLLNVQGFPFALIPKSNWDSRVLFSFFRISGFGKKRWAENEHKFLLNF